MKKMKKMIVFIFLMMPYCFAENRMNYRKIQRIYDTKEKIYCETTGDCHPCPSTEKNTIACKDTSHREELKCIHYENENNLDQITIQPNDTFEIQYRACTKPNDVSFQHFLYFQFTMVLFFAASFILYLQERPNYKNAFDRLRSKSSLPGPRG